MRRGTFDLLTILVLLATLVVWLSFLLVFLDPQSGLNPFAPPTLPARISLPSLTPTPLRLPPSWTPGSGPELVETVAMQPTSMLPQTATPVVRSSFTITPTWTSTPTITPTVTNTPTITRTPTRSPTTNYTATELSRLATRIAQTEAAD